MKKAATKNAPVRMLSLTAFLRFYYFLFDITVSLCSRSFLFLIKLQDRHKCLLWYLHIAHLSHSLLSFLLLFKELSLSGYISAVALGKDILSHGLDCLAGYYLAAYGRLDRDLEQMSRDLILELLAPL